MTETLRSDSHGAIPMVAFRKAQKAHDAADGERWESTDVADTLGGHSTTSSIAIAAPLTSGGHPNSNAPGRHKEDDENLAVSSIGVRRLTPLECTRLQGFPDPWLEGVADSPAYRGLGNAVPVPVIAWVGKRMAAVDAELHP